MSVGIEICAGRYYVIEASSCLFRWTSMGTIKLCCLKYCKSTCDHTANNKRAHLYEMFASMCRHYGNCHQLRFVHISYII